MARRKQVEVAEGVDMPSGVRNELMQTMDALAYQRPSDEALILRLARIGQLGEVERAILRRREYAKRARG